MATKEHDEVQRQIVSMLTQRGWLVTSTANGADMAASQRVRQARAGVRRGVPDVLCFDGPEGFRGVAIEVKTGTGKLTPEQRRWLERLTERGWLAMVAGSAEEVQKKLEEQV
jgi:Holliday junction resolvase